MRRRCGVLRETQETEEIIERVAALDIGKAEVMCCVRVPGEDRPGRRLQEVSAYPAMTRSLLALADRLASLGVTRVVMEATADYWKPPVRARRGELPADQVRRPGCGQIRPGRADPLTAPGTVQAQFAHQPLHRAPGHRHALAVQREPDLPGAVDALVGRMHSSDRGFQLLIPHPPRGRAAGDRVVVSGRGDHAAVLRQHPADRLNPEPGPVLADEPHE